MSNKKLTDKELEKVSGGSFMSGSQSGTIVSPTDWCSNFQFKTGQGMPLKQCQNCKFSKTTNRGLTCNYGSSVNSVCAM